jgi:hypothetical protein
MVAFRATLQRERRTNNQDEQPDAYWMNFPANPQRNRRLYRATSRSRDALAFGRTLSISVRVTESMVGRGGLEPTTSLVLGP